ncbi:Uncharacterized membrane protein [Halobiforma haloterrestris]|uniref:Uncharacterized membrane protein n=1 Tax=Natronobacterium haloterrestre TaxID=148448 RepID=A0A1I1K784_NATHA|nr:SHOCT domain-containing protein [Halobiforma haloterrestris]SFC56411.1 Uncharacterized membrane protein [Halobiforma haloterrestris]
MGVPAWFRTLPTWAAVLSGLLAVLVAMTALSMVLGIVFAGIAIGVEVGSLAVGIVAALLGLTIVLVPVVAAVLVLSSDDEPDTVGDEPIPEVDSLRERYLNGDLDEEAFERRLDELLADADDEPGSLPSGERPGEGRSLLEEHDR